MPAATICEHGITPKGRCEECKRAYHRAHLAAWKGTHPGWDAERARIYRSKNPGRAKASRAIFLTSHKDYMKAYYAAYDVRRGRSTRADALTAFDQAKEAVASRRAVEAPRRTATRCRHGIVKWVCAACASEKKAAYYRENCRRILADTKARAAASKLANPERVRALARKRGRTYRLAHPERVRTQVAAYQRAHPDKPGEWGRRRRARKKVCAVETYRRADIFRRDGGRCHICKKRVGKVWHLDHLVPIVKGGADAEWNVAVAHPLCNFRRGPGRLPAQLRLTL